jgi:hypothetical protein
MIQSKDSVAKELKVNLYPINYMPLVFTTTSNFQQG